MKSDTNNPELAARVLTTASCSSLSGKSKLTYHVGCTADSEILFRIHSNSAAGAFSQEWVSLEAIRQAFAKAPGEKAITSFHLRPLYSGRSINTPAFLLAALKSEGLVRPSSSKRRCHECVDDARFNAAIKALLAEGDRPKAEDQSTKGGANVSKSTGKKQATKGNARLPSKVATKSALKQMDQVAVTKGNDVA